MRSPLELAVTITNDTPFFYRQRETQILTSGFSISRWNR